MKIINERSARRRLANTVKPIGVNAWGRVNGLSGSYVSLMISGKRPINDSVAKLIGLKRLDQAFEVL